MKFIHLTDPHLVEPPQKLFDLDGQERLAAAVASINKHHADAEMCVLTGDLTHWGEPTAYGDIKDIMGQLTIPWHVILGNHDDRNVFREAFPDAADDGNGFVQYSLTTEAGRFLLLDTLDAGTASGAYCPERLGWLAENLDDARIGGEDVFLFMHHAPMVVGIAGLDRIRLRQEDAETFAQMITGSGNVRHIFYGHLHRPCHGSWRGIPFSSVRATAHHTALTLDPETPLTVCHENPGYAAVLIGDDSVVIHDHSYLDEGGEFEYHRGIPDDADEAPEHQRGWD